MKQSIKRYSKNIIIFIFVFVIIFVTFEGFASFFLYFHKISFKYWGGLHSRVHVQYDDLLGWKNIPNLYLEDVYGPGMYFQTNSQSFRNKEDFEITVPVGKTRIICSGDSFTLGVPVDNDSTWCQLLTKKNSRLEVVNLGEAGYGIGQAYLKYKRDGRVLDHDLHIFSFIYDDFRRMGLYTYVAYDKPVVKLENEQIVVDNIPVPRRSSSMTWLLLNRNLFRQLKTVELGGKLLERIKPSPENPERTDVSQTRETVLRVFEDLSLMNRQKDSTVVFVYLAESIQSIVDMPPKVDAWRKFIHRELGNRNLLFIDLVGEFRALPASKLKEMFNPTFGHYSKQGNQFVADILYKRLINIPEVSNKFSGNTEK